MTTNQQITVAALENQAFALMSRLHVILRREQGRVTDIEYMRVDPAYCRHILGLAEETGNEDLRQICARLQETYFGEGGLFVIRQKTPLLGRAAATVAPTPQAPAEDVPKAPTAVLSARAAAVQSYVGRLR